MTQPTKTSVEAKLFPVPTNRPGSVQRQLDDELVKSLHEIKQATEETLARIQEINTALISMYHYIADNAQCCHSDEEETTSSIEKFAFLTKELRTNVNELNYKTDKSKRDIKELQKACSDNMTKHLSKLAICPKSGELISNHEAIFRATNTDCTYCEGIFPGNYNYVPGTM